VISGDRILDIAPPGAVSDEVAREIVDANGMVVCPGFIDILSQSTVALMADGRSLSKVTQGVTTEIMGEAWTPGPVGGEFREPLGDYSTYAWESRIRRSLVTTAPEWLERSHHWRGFRDWLDALAERGVSTNVGSFLPAGILRRSIGKMSTATPDAAEMAAMCRLLEEAMDAGALGVSYVLTNPLKVSVTQDEMVELARTAGKGHGLFSIHIRSEGDRLVEAVDEALEVGRRASAPVEIFHLKAAGRDNWTKLAEVFEHVARARDDGLDVGADLLPYTSAGTGLTAVLPPSASAGASPFEALRRPDVRDRVRQEMLNPTGGWDPLARWAGADGIVPIGLDRPENRRFNGMRMTEIANIRGSDYIDTIFDLLVEEAQRIETLYFLIDEQNVIDELNQPWMKIGTDSGGMDPAWAAALGPTHPRTYGTFPRVLGRYVREKRAAGLEATIRKMSAAAAARLGMRDRGLLVRGFAADVVVFDPARIGERATYQEQHRLAEGVRDVWVNGVRVLRDSQHTGATPGRVVGGPAQS